MTYTPAAEFFRPDHDRVRRNLVPACVAVLVSTFGLVLYGSHGRGEIAIVLSVLLATIAGVYRSLLPRKLNQPSAGGTALTLSLTAIALLVPAFWSGLPLVLGVAGAMLGYAGRNAVTGSRQCVAALAVGTLASIGYFAIYILDTLAEMGVSWAF